MTMTITVKDLLAIINDDVALEIGYNGDGDTTIYEDLWAYREDAYENDKDKKVRCVEPVVLYLDDTAARSLYIEVVA